MRKLVASLLFAAACSSAYADRAQVPMTPGPRIAIDVAPAKIRAPYDVQIIREDGETLPTYAARDRFYVQGTAGERYTVLISNPTAHRVEAVVTVDGLDAIDGEAGDLHKRGYIVPAYGQTRIEGFRTSLSDVATFRFSSVDGSYAGQKGKARNVGVIAVALFEEEAPPEQQIITNGIPPYSYEDDLDEAQASSPRQPRHHGGGDVARAEKNKKDAGDWEDAKKAPTTTGTRSRPAEVAPSAPSGAGGGGRAMPAPPPPHRVAEADESAGDYDGRMYEPPVQNAAPPTYRPGLGTEFGESRYSAASYTQFIRSTQRPVAIAELRYNDAAGLMALGIPVQPLPDQGEIMLRETADPFPGDRFARPPGR